MVAPSPHPSAEPIQEDHPRGLSSWALLLFALPILVGVGLRLWNLDGQILMGDELKGILVALDEPLGSILTTYREQDACIPLSALYRGLVVLGVPLSEASLRALPLASGLALLGVPLLLLAGWRRRVTGLTVRSAWLWTVLLALSPTLVLYSRIARPYAPVVLLGTVAVAGFWVWWRSPSRRQARRGAAAYLGAGALALWFHLVAAPFLLAPFLWALGDLALPGRESVPGVPSAGRRQALRHLAGLGLALALLCGLWLAPAWSSLLEVLRAKEGASSPGLASWLGAWELLAGGWDAWFVVQVFFLALTGFLALARRSPALATYTCVLVAAQGVGLAVLSPLGMESPPVLERYLLVVAPLVLLWAALGIDGVTRWLERLFGRGPKRSAAIGWGAAMFLMLCLVPFNPLVLEPEVRLGPFAGSTALLGSFQPLPEPPAAAVPEVYRILAPGARDGAGNGSGGQASPMPGAVLEAPMTLAWNDNLAPMVLQTLHGRPVRVGHRDRRLSGPSVALESLTLLAAPAALEAAAAPSSGMPIRWVVIHRDPYRFHRAYRALFDPPPVEDWPKARREHLARVADQVERRLTRAWGRPHWSDPETLGGTVLWDLERVRLTAERPPPRSSPPISVTPPSP